MFATVLTTITTIWRPGFSYSKFLFKSITFKKNNKRTKNPVNCFLDDDASAAMSSPQTSIVIKLFQTP